MLRLFCARTASTHHLHALHPRTAPPPPPALNAVPDRRLRALVLGAGPTGALTAFALAQAGWQVQLRDPLSAQQLRQRNRAYAFTHSSRSLLEQLGLWQSLQANLVPFSSLMLCDTGSGAAPVQFSAGDLAAPAAKANGSVGWIGLHTPLMGGLLQALEHHPAVQLQLGTMPTGPVVAEPDSQPHAEVDLVVAADGPYSPTRAALGIGLWQWNYRQSCLTAQVQLRGCGEAQAWELFRPEGPFALLPLGADHVQLVWSAPAARCRQLESLDAVGFLDSLAGALPDRFQPDALEEPPRAFPVALALARRLHRGRTVLVGESAHRCHPVGGQGLNLCWRDVAVLHGLALRASQGRLLPAALPGRYSRNRWADLLLTLVATDLLVRGFSNRLPALLPIRRLALGWLRRSSLLRRLSLGVMTQGPCRPRAF